MEATATIKNLKECQAILWLIVAGMVLSNTAFGQDVPEEELFRDANAVLVIVDSTEADAYRTVSRFLIRDGFRIENSDSDLWTFTTDWRTLDLGGKRFSKKSVEVQLDGYAFKHEGRAAVLVYGLTRGGSGVIHRTSGGSDEAEIRWGKMKGTSSRVAMAELGELLGGIPGAEILYTIR